MEGGIDDVGLGVLFGLELYQLRVCRAADARGTPGGGARRGAAHHQRAAHQARRRHRPDRPSTTAISDELFAKIARLHPHCRALYGHDHLHPRESRACARRLLELGISQISGGSRTSVGGYTEEERPARHRAVRRVRPAHAGRGGALADGARAIIPSFCTACYREGRTGDRFMSLCKSGQIQNCCHPNALMTLNEYLRGLRQRGNEARRLRADRARACRRFPRKRCARSPGRTSRPSAPPTAATSGSKAPPRRLTRAEAPCYNGLRKQPMRRKII